MSTQLVETQLGSVSLERVGEGPDLVILHSLLTDRHAFDQVVPDLSRSNRVNLVDLPGFGQSTPVGPSIDEYADAVGALLAAGDFDPAATVLLGNGLGAFVALGTAVRHGTRLSRLVLVGCGLAFPDPAKGAFTAMAESVMAAGMEAVVDVAVRRIFPEEYLAAHPHVVDERRRVLVRTSPSAFATACRALHDVDYREAAPSVTMPTLIVVGSDDGPTPPALARQAHAAMSGSTLVELNGVGHAPQMQDPATFVDTVRPFVSGEQDG